MLANKEARLHVSRSATDLLKHQSMGCIGEDACKPACRQEMHESMQAEEPNALMKACKYTVAKT